MRRKIKLTVLFLSVLLVISSGFFLGTYFFNLTYHPSIKPQILGLATNNLLDDNRAMVFELNTDGIINSGQGGIGQNELTVGKSKITAEIFRQNEKVDATVKIIALTNKKNTFRLEVIPGPNYKPGLYQIRVSIDGKQSHVLSQDFSWGVLAVNLRRSIERPNTKTEIDLTVLNDTGLTICNADVKVGVIAPNSQRQDFSTADKSVIMNPGCADKSVTNNPDYKVNYTTQGTGLYTIEVEANTTNGTRSFVDGFEVKDDVPFDVERTAFPTRIYPNALYPVSFTITPNQDYQGPVVETVPSSFGIDNISNNGVVTKLDDQNKQIIWQMDWKKGESHQLSYTIDFPKISPAYYAIGPLKIGSLKESRQWQIASDSTNTCVAILAGAWRATPSTTYWSGCGSTYPNTSDIVQIGNFAMTIPSGEADAAASLTFMTTSGGSLTIASTGTLALSGALTVNSLAGTAMTGTVAGTGAITCASIQVGSTVTPSSTVVTKLTSTIASLTSSGAITLTSYKSSTKYNNPTFDLQTGTVSATTVTMPTLSSTTSTFINTGGVHTGYLNLSSTTPWTVPTTQGVTTLNGVGSTVEYSAAGAVPVRVTLYNSLKLTGASGTYTGAVASVSGALTMSGGVIWTADVITTTMTSITLTGTAQLTVGANTTTSGVLSIGDGTNFTVGAFTLNVGTTTTIGTGTSGSLDITSATSTKTFTGVVTINAGADFTESAAATLVFSSDVTIAGTLTESGAAVVGVAGNLTNNGTYTASTGIHTFSGTSKTISGTAATVIPSLSVSVSVANSNTLTVSTTLAGAGTLTNAAAGILNIGGTSGITYLTATAVGNTVNYTGAAQTVHNNAYHHLNLSGSLAKTMTGIGTVAGNMTMAGSCTATTAAAFTISGSLDISGTAMLTTGAYTFSVGTTTHIASGGDLIFSSATNPGKTFTGDVTIDSGGVWNEQAAITPIFWGSLTNNATTWTASTGVHSFSGTSKTISGSTETTIPSIWINGTIGNSNTLTVSTTLAGGSYLTNNAGATLNIGAATASMTLTVLNASAATNTVNYNGTGGQTVKDTSGHHYSNLTITCGTGTATLAAAVLVDNNLTITSGTLSTSASNYAMTVTGNWSNSGTFTAGTGTVTFNKSSATQTLNSGGTSAGYAFSGLTHSGAGTLQLITNAIDINGIFTNSAGTFDTNSLSQTYSGSFANSATFTAGTTTSTFDGAGTQTLNSGGTGTNYSFYSLTHSGAGTLQLITNDIEIDGDFTNSGGIFDTNSKNQSIKGSFTNSTTFTAGTTTTNFIGTASGKTINLGSSSLYNLTFNGSGGTWSPTATSTTGSSGIGATVNAIAAVDATHVYVGGLFTNQGGVTGRNYIAMWNGSAWSTVGAINDVNYSVYAIAAVDATHVYVGGNFTSLAGVTGRDHLAMWNGSAWSTVGAISDVNSAVYAIAAVDATHVYIGGYFGSLAGVTGRDYLAMWNGSAWSTVGAISDVNSAVYAIAVLDATHVYIGGYFSSLAGVTGRNYLAMWNGSAWSTVGAINDVNYAVNAITAVDATHVYVGGLFTNQGGVTGRNYIAMWNGSAWSTVGAINDVNYSVYAIAAVDATHVYVGGNFTSLAGVTGRDRLAMWNGSAWSTLAQPPASIITITNDLTMTAGTLDNSNGSSDMTVNGNVTGTAGIINFTTNTLTQQIGSAKGFGSSGGTSDWTFYNLRFEDSSAGDLASTSSSGGSGKIIVNGTLTVGNTGNSNITTFKNDTNNRILDIVNVAITSKGVLIASGSAAFNVSGNFSNANGFTDSSGTVTFDGSAAQSITAGGNNSGHDFYNLVVTNSAGPTNGVTFADSLTVATGGTFTDTANDSKLIFTTGQAFTFPNININGTSGHNVILTSTNASPGTASGPTWSFVVAQASPAVTYATVYDSNATGSSSQINASSNCTNGGNNTYWNFVSNHAPNSPTSLVQKKVTGGATLAVGDWTNETQVQFSATASDTDNPDTLYLCVEKDSINAAFTSANGGDICGSGVAYSGTPVTVSVSITGLTDATQYHWQAQVKDAAAAYSSFVGYGSNTENPPTNPAARDFGIDTTAPTGGSVTDGGNTDSLTVLAASWSGFTDPTSGIAKYEYAIGTTTGGTDIQNWTNNSTSTSATVTGLNLITSRFYYFSVRATDNAGNVGTAVNSSGKQVTPTLSFSLDSNNVIFSNLNAASDWTSQKSSTITTSTNAAFGYTVSAYMPNLMWSTEQPTNTINNFVGTWASPLTWSTQFGFGYTSSDSNIQGSNHFGGGTQYAAFNQTAPGDVVADHTAAINGLTGAVTNEQFTITYQIAVPSTQAASQYKTNIDYIVTANY